MSITKTITYDHEFAQWVKKSDSYSNKFTFEGANALQEYLEQLSEDIGENIEFDPIAWCCEYSEYTTAQEAYEEHEGDKADTYNEAEALQWLQDNTPVIEIDGTDRVIIQDF